MGKALLIMVLGTGLFVSLKFMSTHESLLHTAGQQAAYEEEVIAREIARSGFNAAMGIVRPYGSRVLDASQAVNGEQGIMRGEHQGGEYRVKAYARTGFSIEIVSTGYFGGRWENGEYKGGAQHTMREDYFIPVLTSRRCNLLHVKFLESRTSYCSAVYLQRYPRGVTALTLPPPEMLFPAGHNGDHDSLTVEKYIGPGTQMNFFIAVDKDCSTRPGGPLGLLGNYNVLNHIFNPRDYDHLHEALDYDIGQPRNMKEAVWTLVEQHAEDYQRWRIAWEDTHRPAWNNAQSDNPRESLQALKLYGYDGLGWPDRELGSGYRLLRDTPSLDLSDQVVEIRLTPANPLESGGVCAVYNAGTDPDGGGVIPGGGDGDGGSGGGSDGGSGDGGDGGSDGGSGGGSGGGDGGGSQPEGCGCPQGQPDKKVAIMHRPPGNESNEHIICVARSGADAHLRRHNDYELCEGQ